MTTPHLNITPELLRKHDKPGPRYTSYPTAPVWTPEIGESEYGEALQRASERSSEPLSLYVHIPFCAERCHYCGCNVVITKKSEIAVPYLKNLAKELEIVAGRLGDRRQLGQLHWGGGTPTYLTPAQMQELFDEIKRHFTFAPEAEIALEIDPRVTSLEHIETLRELGFNRISMGVQDLDSKVQEAINRNQSEDETRRIFSLCREAGFEGINIDLIYGLPEQTSETWANTIDSIIDIRPDRLAIYSYAHLPERIKHQKKMNPDVMPDAEEKGGLLAYARNTLTEAGYTAIGMDHFALPEDELARAMDEKRLFRNFMGYTTVAAREMVGVGTSAISRIGGVYAQNEKRLVYYNRRLEENHLPTSVGCRLSKDDEIRSWVIQELMCNFRVDFVQLTQEFNIEFDEYFGSEEQELQEYYEQEFLVRDEDGLQVLPLGQIFVRNIAMVFDAYLQKQLGSVQFSRTV